jgi:hypothetical protein
MGTMVVFSFPLIQPPPPGKAVRGDLVAPRTVPAAGKLPEIPEETIIAKDSSRFPEYVRRTVHCGLYGGFTRCDKGNPGRKGIHHALAKI